MRVEIRQCESSDLEACAKVFREVFAEAPYGADWPLEEALAYLRKFHSFDPGVCYVAVSGDRVVAALLGYRYPWRARAEYHVQEIFVHRDHRRQGIGRRLIDRVVSDLGGDVNVSLVANERTGAAKFYRSLGITQHRYYKFYCGRVRAD